MSQQSEEEKKNSQTDYSSWVGDFVHVTWSAKAEYKAVVIACDLERKSKVIGADEMVETPLKLLYEDGTMEWMNPKHYKLRREYVKIVDGNEETQFDEFEPDADATDKRFEDCSDNEYLDGYYDVFYLKDLKKNDNNEENNPYSLRALINRKNGNKRKSSEEIKNEEMSKMRYKMNLQFEGRKRKDFRNEDGTVNCCKILDVKGVAEQCLNDNEFDESYHIIGEMKKDCGNLTFSMHPTTGFNVYPVLEVRCDFGMKEIAWGRFEGKWNEKGKPRSRNKFKMIKSGKKQDIEDSGDTNADANNSTNSNNNSSNSSDNNNNNNNNNSNSSSSSGKD